MPELAERTRRYSNLLPRGGYNQARQRQFCASLLRDMGFDFARGRLDRSTHPFTMMASDDDVRLTIRTSAEEPLRAIFATLHEGGHALYDQGLPRELHGTLLADAPSMGVHESQARLWENHVGRSAAFWRHYFPKLKTAFPTQLGALDARGFQRAINVVVPGVNRVAADEATYNLHVLVRYELEIALLDGDLAVADLPGAWDERYRALPRRQRGQPARRLLAGRALGARRVRLLPDLHDRQPLRGAARRRVRREPRSRRRARRRQLERAARPGSPRIVYAHGAELPAEALIERITGRTLDVEPFFRRLERRVAELE